MNQGTNRVRMGADRLNASGSVPVPLELGFMDSKSLDPGRVAELYQLHAVDLQAFLLGLLRDRELACEALQVTFSKVLEVGADEIRDLKGWLFRVAFREAMNIRRREQIDRRCLKKVAWNLATATGSQFQSGGKFEKAETSTPGSEERPEDRLAKREDIERVRSVLVTLPPEQQKVVRMRMYDEKTFQCIADELNIPLGTVLSRMRLALTKLKLLLN